LSDPKINKKARFGNNQKAKSSSKYVAKSDLKLLYFIQHSKSQKNGQRAKPFVLANSFKKGHMAVIFQDYYEREKQE